MLQIDYANLEFIDPMVREIVLAVHEEFPEANTITSLLRIPLNQGSTHETLPLRATDLRCWDDDLGEAIEKWVNTRWLYDPSRPHKKVCMYHENRSGGGKHLHFQSHPNTVKV